MGVLLTDEKIQSFPQFPVRTISTICIRHPGTLTNAGGDAFITICLWKLGFAHTDPGPYFNSEAMRLFDAAASMNSQDLADRLFEAAEDVCDHPICPVSKHNLNNGKATFDML